MNSGKLRVHTEAEQQIWNECSRLIANAVIYYNAVITSCVLAQKQASGDQEAVEIIKDTSPVAWRHVNLIGRFEFNKAEKVDLDALVRIFEEPECWIRLMREERLEDWKSPAPYFVHFRRLKSQHVTCPKLERNQNYRQNGEFYLFEGLGINSRYGFPSVSLRLIQAGKTRNDDNATDPLLLSKT